MRYLLITVFLVSTFVASSQSNSKEFKAANLAGTISHQLKGYETVNDMRCAVVETGIDLQTSTESNSLPDKIQWKGKGILYYNPESARIEKSSWNVAKKTESEDKDKDIPKQFIEIFNLSIEYLPPEKTIQDPPS